jgi:ligand-binding sensor domain-containing protein
MRMRTIVVTCCLVAGLGAAKARGADLRGVMTDVTVTSWSQRDGLPDATIMALAQASDGYLWIGSRDGLFRFDGTRFEGWESLGFAALPTLNVRSLWTTSRGDLWIGFGDTAGVACLSHGQLTVYSDRDGLAGRTVWVVVEDAQGVMWAGTDAGLFRQEGGRWDRWSGAHGIGTGPIYSAYLARTGTLYVGGATGVFELERDRAQFERADAFNDTFAESADGRVWVTDPTVGLSRWL